MELIDDTDGKQDRTERGVRCRWAPTQAEAPMRRVQQGPNGRGGVRGNALDEGTFEEALRTALGLAQALEGTRPEPAANATTSGALASAAAVDQFGNAHDALSRTLDRLGTEHASRLAAVMVAGRDGIALSAAASQITKEPTPRPVAQTGLADFLQRGQSIAYATEFPLERPLEKWSEWSPRNLVERAWLSFGRQLALSRPDEWECFGLTDAPLTRQLTRLYLRASGGTWWSFRRQLDRPSARVAEMARAGAASTLLACGSLTWFADARCFTEGRALRRALHAIRARLGACSA